MSDKNDNVDNDFEFVRQTQYDLLVKGSSALEAMMDVARATEHPRAYEVLSNMMKNVADISNNLLDLHKKQKDYHKEEREALPPPGQTTNNVFIGSTSDLQRMLLNKDNEESDKVVDITDYKKDE